MWSSSFDFFLLIGLFSNLLDARTPSIDATKEVEVFASNSGRIVNGTKAAIKQFPYQVSLRRVLSRSHFCGGSIIRKDLVVTAAHCMFIEDKLIKEWTIMIVAGELELSKFTNNGQITGVSSYIVHEKFDADTMENDIALLFLTVPFDFTSYVSAALLPLKPPAPGTICQVSGWGYPHEDIWQVSNDLMYVDVPILHIPLCRVLLAGIANVTPGMFCAGYLEGGKDACQGDSGGGITCNGVLTGIVSFGEGCARPKLPGFYTDLSYYIDWISKPLNYRDDIHATNAAPSISFSRLSFFPVYVAIVIPVATIPIIIAS